MFEDAHLHHLAQKVDAVMPCEIGDEQELTLLSKKRMASSGCRSCEFLRKRSAHPRELASASGEDLPDGREEDRCIEVQKRSLSGAARSEKRLRIGAE